MVLLELRDRIDLVEDVGDLGDHPGKETHAHNLEAVGKYIFP